MDELKTVASQWDEFDRVFLAMVHNPTQILETKRAFYAGAFSLLMLLHRVSNEAVGDEAFVDYLEALKLECLAFYELMEKGEA